MRMITERRLVHFSNLDAGFGVTADDNSIHRTNNNSAMDHGLGVTARGARHIVDFGNNVASAITGKERRHAYPGIMGGTRARVMDVLATPIDLITKKNRIGTAVNGVMSAFDAAAYATIVDPLTMAAGDHTNTPRHAHLEQFSQEELDAAKNN